ncbi:TIGR03773 family transporter-associated surface protein [Kribbella sandramycini]|uniref:TIGR03773 family transporter-associated surface protein n=1 Tax=Kribbella sandramycini TaxID=60450 RepID=UPI0031DD5CB2
MTATHSRPALLSAFLSLVLGALCLLVPLSAQAAPEVLRAVHTDALHPTYDGAALKLATRIGTGDYRAADPANLVFNLEDRGSARTELPDLPAFAFLGAPGSTVFIAPESQDPELIWPGWDTETLPTGVFRDDSIELTLLSAEGPGAVEVFFNYDEFSGTVPRLFSSVDPAYRTLRQPVGRHVHANWSFSALGTYTLTFQATATTTTGTHLTSPPTTYTWAVGPYTPPTTPPTTPPGTPPGSPTPPTTSPTSPPSPTPTGPSSPTEPPSPTPTPSGPPSPSAAPSNSPTQHPPLTPAPTPRPTPPASQPTTTPVRAPGTAADTRACITTPSPTTSPPTTFPRPTTLSPPPQPPTTTTTTLQTGHADYAARLENGVLRTRIKDGTQPGAPTWRDPKDVTIRLTAAAGTTSPGGAFSFLGPKGTPVWQIPQTQKTGVIWLGWNTEELKPGQLPGDQLTWRLDKLTGPGRFAIFEFNPFGQPQIIFNSADGLPDTYKVPVGTHAHGNWTFTKPGTYRLTFTHAAGTQTATNTLTVVVAPGGARSIPAEAPLAVATPDPNCRLAATGADVSPGWIAAAVLFLLLGTGLLLVARRGTR